MSDFDVRDKYDSLEQPWWANDFLILILTMINIGIIILDLELELFENNFSLWWKLAVLDLVLVGFFFADLIEDYSRCNDKSWWWKTHGWEFLGIPPMFLAGLPFLSGVISLKFLRLIRAFAGILRMIGATQRANVVPVGKQVQHLFMIVFSLIVSGAFAVLSSALIMFHTSNIVHGGERNYIMATVSIFVALYNIFISLLHILSVFAGNRD